MVEGTVQKRIGWQSPFEELASPCQNTFRFAPVERKYSAFFAAVDSGEVADAHVEDLAEQLAGNPARGLALFAQPTSTVCLRAESYTIACV